MPLQKATVSTILGEKTSSIYCVTLNSTVESAVSEMNRQRVGSVLIKERERCVGIFTERDVLTRVVSGGRDPKTTPLSDVMTRDFQFIAEDTTVEDAMQIMTDKRVRHLPVFNGEKLVGMISIGDVTRWLLKLNELEAENLRKYVFSEYPG